MVKHRPDFLLPNNTTSVVRTGQLWRVFRESFNKKNDSDMSRSYCKIDPILVLLSSLYDFTTGLASDFISYNIVLKNKKSVIIYYWNVWGLYSRNVLQHHIHHVILKACCDSAVMVTAMLYNAAMQRTNAWYMKIQFREKLLHNILYIKSVAERKTAVTPCIANALELLQSCAKLSKWLIHTVCALPSFVVVL